MVSHPHCVSPPVHNSAVFCRLLWAVFFLTVCVSIRAEHLPIKTYTTSDGLPRNFINRIVRDSHGFLWFCTVEGLSRFDGYTFSNYGVEQGIPDRDVRDLIETRGGEYWIATQNGIAWFNPEASPDSSASERKTSGRGLAPGLHFVSFPMTWAPNARSVDALLEDRNGTIWCGTAAGLCQLKRAGGERRFERVDLGTASGDANSITVLLEENDGALWIGTWDGLFRRWPDGRVERYGGRNGLPSRGEHPIRALLEDRAGRLWVGAEQGLFLLEPKPDPKRSIIARTFTTEQALPHNYVDSLLQSSGGKIWIGTAHGLAELSPAGREEGSRIRAYPTVRAGISALSEDREGNLWMGTQDGAMRLARNGFTTYAAKDGFANGGVNSIFEDQAGDLCVINKVHDKLTVHRFDGTHFASARFKLPPWITNPGWGWSQIGFQDHEGEWWLATGQGLCRYPKVSRVEDLAHTPPSAVYTSKHGLAGDVIFRTYEDTHGDIWVSGTGGLTRWKRATDTFQARMPPEEVSARWAVASFAEDRLGNLWMGFYWHDLARYRDGHFTVYTPAEGLPSGSIVSLFVDHLGRLWIAGTRGGLSRIDHPGTDPPRFVKFPANEGISNADVECITEDQWGRIYVGTGHGLYRLDPDTGQTKRYTTADGVVDDPIVAFRDRKGVLWFGSSQGLSRFVPEFEEPEGRASPPIRITGLRITGFPYPVSELGETHLTGLVLEPNQNDVQVDFSSLDFGVGEVIRYQFRLEGINQDWSPATDQRRVNFARLGPGEYRLHVRALDSEGMVSADPATVSFRVLAPVWQRAWFLAAAGLLVALAVYSLYRYRVARLLELERVRTRIATDLHDDIGASLSGMAFLSEAVKLRIGGAGPEALEMAGEVAVMARGLARSLSDVVWSIDPRRDNLQNLIARVRQYAAAVLEIQGINLSLQVPLDPDKIKLTPEQRHHVFLIFKEALNNIARHAHCASATLTIKVEAHQLRAEIVDDGCGFSDAPSPETTKQEHGGNGLNNMKLRAAQLGGRINVVSTADRGTRLELAVPL